MVCFHYVQKRLIPRNDVRSCEGAAFLLQSKERLLVMARNDTTFGSCFQTLQPLGTREPGWMISGQPSLRNTITPVFDYLYRPCEHLFPKGRERRLTWQWSLMNRNVPLSAMLICIPIRPVPVSIRLSLLYSNATYHRCGRASGAK